MARRYTLNAPAAGICLAWPAAVTVVLDPGTDETSRRHTLVREYLLVASAVVLSLTALAILTLSEPGDRPWVATLGLLASAWACHMARPARRAVPAELVELLEPLRDHAPARPGEIHRLVWEVADLTAATEGTDTSSFTICAHRVAQIKARLRGLASPAVQAVPSWAVLGRSVRQTSDPALSSIPDTHTAHQPTSCTSSSLLRQGR